MQAKRIVPILNVSNIVQSFTWFEKLGWKKGFEWGEPVGFGSVYSGECEIFSCEEGQGGRGKGDAKVTFGPDGDESGDKGVWMSIWVDKVDGKLGTVETFTKPGQPMMYEAAYTDNKGEHHEALVKADGKETKE